MKIVKAIEILSELATTLPQSSSEERITAVNLGIEALKVVQDIRIMSMTSFYSLLPGETEE